MEEKEEALGSPQDRDRCGAKESQDEKAQGRGLSRRFALKARVQRLSSQNIQLPGFWQK
jgi:hypothetical protein